MESDWLKHTQMEPFPQTTWAVCTWVRMMDTGMKIQADIKTRKKKIPRGSSHSVHNKMYEMQKSSQSIIYNTAI